MIKLTYNPGRESLSKKFASAPIVIGNGDLESTHFPITLERLQQAHLKIVEENGHFFIYNLANDPFAAVNGLPFLKKKLQDHDTIQLGKEEILFETLTQNKSQPIENKEVKDHFEISSEKGVPPASPLWLIASNWRMIACSLLVLMVLAASIMGGLYLRATGKSSQEEKRIAGAIADIAMALRYAKLNHINPNHLTFSDPDFLKSTISKILSPKLDTLAEIDSQLKFIKHPYILRLYASSNLSRFLMIAQPAPNLFHWVMMKGAIVIDTKTMDLKKIGDIKALNRLLAHPDPLDGRTGEEISLLISQGETMPLPSLAGEKNHWGFTPPTALGFVRPSAENSIYNAPRYHPFGEAYLARALELTHSDVTSEEIAKFRQEVKELAEFGDLVLYSSEGMKVARGGQKALSTLVPEHEFLIGSLKFNQAGIITHSQLLMDENRKDVAKAFDILPLVEVDEMIKSGQIKS
jgi:hypothetical protein